MNKPLNALIIEDSKQDAILLLKELEKGGYDVTYDLIDTEEEMKALLAAKPWEIILSDHRMPYFSSMEALNILKESGLDIPFIIVSGTIGEEVAVEAMRAGASDYILKGNKARLIPAIERELHEAKGRIAKREAIDALKESEERFHAMADTSPMLIWTLDAGGNLAYYNKTFLDFIGYTLEEALEEGWPTLIHPEDLESTLNTISEAIRNQRHFEVEIRIRGYDGHYHWIVGKGAPRFSGSEFTGFIGSSIDITEQKQTFERERLLRRIMEIINGSFDIRDILNRIAKEIGEFFQVDRSYVIRYRKTEAYLNIDIHGEYIRSEDILVFDINDFPPEMLKLLSHNLPIEEAMRHQRFTNVVDYTKDLERRMYLLDHLSDEQKAQYMNYFRGDYIRKYCIGAILRVGIAYRGVPYGVITLQQCNKERVWTDEEVNLLQDITTHIGIAFYQSDLYLQEQQTAKLEMLTRKIIQAVHSPIELDEKVQEMANQLGFLLDADHVFISRYDSNRKLLIPPAQEYRVSEAVPTMLSGSIESLFQESIWVVEQMCKTREPFKFDTETEGLDPKTLHYLKEMQVKSGLGIAITVGEDCLAILFIHQVKSKRIWSPAEIEAIESVARQSGIAIRQAELFEELKIRARQQGAASNLGVQALSDLDLSHLMNQACKYLAENLGVGYAKLLEYHAQKETIEFKAVYGFRSDLVGQEFHLMDEPHAATTLKSDKPVVVQDIWMETRFSPSPLHKEFSLVSGISVIIEGRDGAPYGVLEADDTDRRIYSEDDISFLQTMANVLAMTIERKRIAGEREQAKEEAEIANQRKSQFLATMSHELRTPLNAVIGYSEMILKGMAVTPAKIEKYAQNISASGRHLLDIVNDILDVSKIEAGQLTMNLEYIDIQAFCEGLKDIFSALAAKKRIHVEYQVQSDIDGMIADSARLKQILINLINNAIKFNREGGRVKVRLFKTDDRKWVVCEVEDTGVGISEGNIKELFTEFFQVDNSFSRLHEGTGLGLALTKKLVELHGGNISVESKEGVGSIFTFKIPVLSGFRGALPEKIESLVM